MLASHPEVPAALAAVALVVAAVLAAAPPPVMEDHPAAIFAPRSFVPLSILAAMVAPEPME